jgi:hypothetical protein
MSATVDIDRLSLALHGVSADVAEAAVSGLAPELRRRLGNLNERALVTGDLGVVHVGPILGEATLDVTALRDLIAERLVIALTTPARDADADAAAAPRDDAEGP